MPHFNPTPFFEQGYFVNLPYNTSLRSRLCSRVKRYHFFPVDLFYRPATFELDTLVLFSLPNFRFFPEWCYYFNTHLSVPLFGFNPSLTMYPMQILSSNYFVYLGKEIVNIPTSFCILQQRFYTTG